MSNQGDRQASCRAVTGSTEGNYEEDWLKLFTARGLDPFFASAGITNFNGKLKEYCDRAVGVRFRTIDESMHAFAEYISGGTINTWNELGVFDAETPLAKVLHDFGQHAWFPPDITFVRGSPAWDYNFRQYDENVPRNVPGRGFLLEDTKTNKCTNNSAGQSGLENMTPVAGGTVERISVSQAPADVQNALRDRGYDLSTVQGLFYLTGTSGDGVDIAGATGNTNTHVREIFAYVSSGSADLRWSDGSGSVPLNTGFSPTVDEGTPPSAVVTLRVNCLAAGTGVYFFGNKLEEGQGKLSPLVTSGGTQTRAAETATQTVSPSFPNGAVILADCSWEQLSDEKILSIVDFTGVPGGTQNRIQLQRDPRVAQKLIRLDVTTGGTRRVAINFLLDDSVLNVRAVATAFSGNTTLFVNGVKATIYADGTETTAYTFTAPLAELNYLNRATGERGNGYLRNFALWDQPLSQPPSGFDNGFDGGF